MSLLKQFEHLKIQLEAIISATNNFAEDHRIGEGGFGKIYKAELLLSNGITKVALKRLDRKFGQGDSEFWKEVITLSVYKHENIVSLLGYCDDQGEKILVYEYAAKKSLDLHLNNNDLTWVQRLEICIGAARGLAYLHNPAGSQQRLLHRDIKSSNILLDENWNARVADFGLSKFGPANQDVTFIVSNNIAGTIGYCDPNYFRTGILTKESDVYSFGVVLFEVLCGRLCLHNEDKSLGFVKLVQRCYDDKNLYSIIWSNMNKEIHPSSLDVFSSIAYRCLDGSREKRPSINEVMTRLETALEYQSTINKKPFFMKEFSHLRLGLDFIRHATNNFAPANFVKKVKFQSTVYRGEFFYSGVRTVGTVKRFKQYSKYDSDVLFWGEHQQYSKDHLDVLFWGELLLLSSYRQENLISLLGFCEESQEKIIVYEYAANRDLEFHLYDSNLTWIQRLKICLGAACGLEHIHNRKGNRERMVHGYIRSGNIMLDENWNAKIVGYGLPNIIYDITKTYPPDTSEDITGYYDPERANQRWIRKESAVYSFGVVLFEVLCSRPCRLDKYDPGLVSLLLKIRKQRPDTFINVNLRQQIKQNCFDTFVTLAYQCLEHYPFKRPTMDVVVNKLATALDYQLEPLKLRLKGIKSATKNFSRDNCIPESVYGKVYRGQLDLEKKDTTVALKRLGRVFGDGDPECWKEVIMLSCYRHENIVPLLGFCDERGKKILMYEYASKQSLDQHLANKDLKWVQRLKICIGAARGLAYLHSVVGAKQRVLHYDIKSSNILLDANWNAKIANLGLSKFGQPNRQYPLLLPNVVGRVGYCDPQYLETGILTEESDVYSFGVVLFEVLCGKLCMGNNDHRQPFTTLVRKYYKRNTLKEITFGDIQDEINPNSLKAFATISYQCLKRDREERPLMNEVVTELENALRYQVLPLSQPPPSRPREHGSNVSPVVAYLEDDFDNSVRQEHNESGDDEGNDSSDSSDDE